MLIIEEKKDYKNLQTDVETHTAFKTWCSKKRLKMLPELKRILMNEIGEDINVINGN